MKKLKFRKQLAILLAVAFIFALLPVSAMATVTGYHLSIDVELNDNNISGALVSVNKTGGGYSGTDTTDSGGDAEFSGLSNGNYSYSVTYTDTYGNAYSKTGTFDISGHDKQFDVNFYSHTVTFTVRTTYNYGTLQRGATTADTITIVLPDNADFPARPTTLPDAGYQFDSWQYKWGSNYYGATFPSKVTEDTTWYAKFTPAPKYDVKFYADDHGTLQRGSSTNDYFDNDDVVSGSAFPTVPTPVPDTGYVFDKWMKKVCGNWQVSTGFPATVTEDSSWKATFKLAPCTYNVTFIALDGGTLQEGATTNDTIAHNNLSSGVAFPATPTPVPDATYEFVGWYADQACTITASFPPTVTQSSTWYAKFQVARVPVYQYQINRHYTTSGVTTDVPGSVVSTGDPASITVDPSDYNPYDGKTYAFDAGASSGLTINLVDGQTIVVDLYYTRDAQYTYQIVRHYTMYVDGEFSSYTSKTDGVLTASGNGSVTADPSLYTSNDGMTYTLTGAVGNPTGMLVDTVTAVIELYYSYNDIPLNPPEEPEDDDDDIPLDTAGDPNTLVIFGSIAGAAIAAIAALAVIDIKKNKHNV